LSSQSNASYPRSIGLFKGSGSDNEDVFTEQPARETRPFFLSLRTVAEGSALHISLLRILVKSITLSTTWTVDIVTRVIEVLIGQSSDWGLQSDRKGKAKATSSQFILARLQLVEQLFGCSYVSDIASSAIAALAKRLLEVYATRLSPVEDTMPHVTSPPAEESEIDRQPCQTLVGILTSGSFSESSVLSGQLARFVKVHSHELVWRLVTAAPGHEGDVNGETPQLTSLGSSILLLLASRVLNDGQGGKSGQCLAKQLANNDQDEVRRWLGKTTLSTLTSSLKVETITLQQKRAEILAALPAHPRKRTLEAVEDVEVQNGSASRQTTWSDLDTAAVIKQYFGENDSVAATQEGWRTFLSRKVRECQSVQDLSACRSILCLLSNPCTSVMGAQACSSCTADNDKPSQNDSVVGTVPDDLLCACRDVAFLDTLPSKSRSTALSLVTVAVNHCSPSTILEHFPLSGESSTRRVLRFLNSSSRGVRIAAG